MRTLYLILLFVFGIFSSIFGQSSKKTKSYKDSVLNDCKIQKQIADDYRHHDLKAIIVLVKIEGQRKLVKKNGERLPENAEVTYEIKKDSTGKICKIIQIPASKSGDWDLSCTHYFNPNGNTYCFQKNFSVFYSLVKGGVVLEQLVKYYDSEFNLINSSYTVNDIKGNKLVGKNTPLGLYKTINTFKIYRNLDECLKNYHIKL